VRAAATGAPPLTFIKIVSRDKKAVGAARVLF
jgi:hypothetical protein